MKTILCIAALSCLLPLAGCSVSAVRANGPYLLIGPADAPLAEITMPDTENCKYGLERYYSISKLSQCNASSAALPFAGVARNDFQGISLPVSGRTLTACEDLLKRLGKSSGWRVSEPCKQVGEPFPAVAAAEPKVTISAPASKTEKPKKAVKKNAPSPTQSAPD